MSHEARVLVGDELDPLAALAQALGGDQGALDIGLASVWEGWCRFCDGPWWECFFRCGCERELHADKHTAEFYGIRGGSFELPSYYPLARHVCAQHRLR